MKTYSFFANRFARLQKLAALAARYPGRGFRERGALQDPLYILPVELWNRIFTFVDRTDIHSLTFTCQTFRLIAQPFLFHKFVVHPHFSTNSARTQRRAQEKLAAHSEQMYERLQFFLSPHIAPVITECWIVPPSMDVSVTSLTTLDDLTDAIFDALPTFLNLNSLFCHYIQFSPRRFMDIRDLNLTEITLHSCFTHDEFSPGVLRVPLETVTLRYPEIKGNLELSNPQFLSLFLRSRQLQHLFAGPTDKILMAMIMAKPLDALTELEIPVECIASPKFIPALEGCIALEKLSIYSMDRQTIPPPLKSSSLPPGFLPKLECYRGPIEYVPLLAKNHDLRVIDLTRPSTPELIVKVIQRLRERGQNGSIESLSIRPTELSPSLLRTLLSSCSSLISLIIKEPRLSVSAWTNLFEALASSSSTNGNKPHPTLAKLRFTLDVSDTNGFWRPAMYEIQDTVAFLTKAHPSLTRIFPNLRHLQVVYNEVGGSLIWRPSHSTSHPRSNGTSQLLSDIRVEADIHDRADQGRPLYRDEVRSFGAGGRWRGGF